MPKLLLMSVLFATAIIPAFTAQDRSPLRGLKRACAGMLVFNVLYLLAATLVYPRICW
jgi:hypothetical protein